MKQTPLGNTMPVQIKTITPVHIGGNERLSPLADYWMDGQKNIQLINQEALARFVYDTNNADAYISAVKDVADVNKGRVLPQFVQQNLKKDFDALKSGIYFKSYGVENPIEIDCCIKTDGLPYIPGSSLKGAIRNIFMLDWLCSNTEESNGVLNVFLDRLAKNIPKSKGEQKFKFAEVLKAYAYEVEEIFFDSVNSKQKLPASCLRINDSSNLKNNDLSIYQLERYNLITGEPAIPVLKQCIDANKTVATDIYIDYYDYKQKTFHKMFSGIKDKKDFFSMVNAVSLKLLNHEYNVMGRKKESINKMKAYDSFIGNLKTIIEECDNEKAYLRLGFGKMQFYQTIAIPLLELFDYDEKDAEWKQYLNYTLEFKKDATEIYPATRVLSSAAQEPLGWIELS